jgi:hypothetical protein
MKKVETSDKSTFTINEASTQTDTQSGTKANQSIVQELPVINETPNLHYNDSNNRSYPNKSKKHNRESDGKKLLLEAYLRNNNNNNNNNMTNGGSTPSSGQTNSKKCSLLKLGIKSVLESGIGTISGNDDDDDDDDNDDSLRSLGRDCNMEYDSISESIDEANDDNNKEHIYDTDLFLNKQQRPSDLEN